MKRIKLLLLLLALNAHVLAQCPTGNIVLVSQADVAAFVSANPGCTSIEGDLTIGDPFTPPLSNISSLNGLSGITAIHGKLAITGNNQLQTLAGLENLASLGSLDIGSNPLLTSLAALVGMTPADTSTFDLKIESNDALPSLAGLEGISSARDVSINNSMNLANLTGLSNLTSVSQGLWLFSNSVTSLHGLEKLEHTGGLGISSNRSLVSLDGLKNLTTVAGPVMLQDNDVLVNLKGLEKLTSATGLAIGRHDLMTSLEGLSALTSVNYLIVLENPLLTTCAVKPVCEQLTSPNVTMSIQDNATGCNTMAEISEACQSLPVTLVDFTAKSEGNTVHLTWTTSEETNSDYFEIQASTDTENWRALGTVPSKGDSREVNHYAFTDNNPFHSTNYYRLKMVDRAAGDSEGAFTFSRIRSVDLNKLRVAVHPNPSADLVYLLGVDIQKVTSMELTDQSGNAIRRSAKKPDDGLSLAGISPGIYFLRIYQKDGRSSLFKVIKN